MHDMMHVQAKCTATRRGGEPCAALGVPKFEGYCVGHRPRRKDKQGRNPREALSEGKVRKATLGIYADGNGLYLRVADSGARQWVQRQVINGKRHCLGLGGYPVVSLANAREQALANLRLTRAGGDPRSERRREAIPTVARAAAKVIEMYRPTWTNEKHAYQWEMSFTKYVNPVIGSRLVNQVTSADVLAALTPIWTSKHDTAVRIRQRIGTVMEWAIVQGYRADNPAGRALNRVLPRMPRVQDHQPALPYTEVHAAIQAMHETDAGLATKLSFEILVLTASRSTEVRLARWDEVDWASKTWTIPAERMKGRKGIRREHRVPLSKRALAILVEARALDNGSGLVFPSALTGGPVSNNTHRKRMINLGLRAGNGRYAVPHGFRSSFRDWASEQTDTPHAVMEAALTHKTKDATEAAYARSDLFERRRILMEQWAKYLECRRD